MAPSGGAHFFLTGRVIEHLAELVMVGYLGHQLQRSQTMFAYKGSTALITGASKGLGAAFAKELASRGMNLVLVARSIDTLHDLADSLGAQYGVRCVVLQADLATSDAVKRIVTELGSLDLKIDLLINNARLGLTGDFL